MIRDVPMNDILLIETPLTLAGCAMRFDYSCHVWPRALRLVSVFEYCSTSYLYIHFVFIKISNFS